MFEHWNLGCALLQLHDLCFTVPWTDHQNQIVTRHCQHQHEHRSSNPDWHHNWFFVTPIKIELNFVKCIYLLFSSQKKKAHIFKHTNTAQVGPQKTTAQLDNLIRCRQHSCSHNIYIYIYIHTYISIYQSQYIAFYYYYYAVWTINKTRKNSALSVFLFWNIFCDPVARHQWTNLGLSPNSIILLC